MGEGREAVGKKLVADKRETRIESRRFYIFKRNQESSLPSGSKPTLAQRDRGTDKPVHGVAEGEGGGVGGGEGGEGASD